MVFICNTNLIIEPKKEKTLKKQKTKPKKYVQLPKKLSIIPKDRKDTQKQTKK